MYEFQPARSNAGRLLAYRGIQRKTNFHPQLACVFFIKQDKSVMSNVRRINKYAPQMKPYVYIRGQAETLRPTGTPDVHGDDITHDGTQTLWVLT